MAVTWYAREGERMTGLVLIVVLMVLLDLAALRWGADSRSTDADGVHSNI